MFDKDENVLRYMVRYNFLKASSQALPLNESTLKELLENKAASKMKRTRILNLILLIPEIIGNTLDMIKTK